MTTGNTTTDREKGEQRVLQLFHPPVLPFRLTQLCGMITEKDNRYTGIKAPDFFNVTFYVYSADPTVDTRYNLPRPGTELAHSSLCQINKTSPRWWYPTIDWNCLPFSLPPSICVHKQREIVCVHVLTPLPHPPTHNSEDLERDHIRWSWLEPV